MGHIFSPHINSSDIRTINLTKEVIWRFTNLYTVQVYTNTTYILYGKQNSMQNIFRSDITE